jgi:hypothetical protein
MSQSLRHPVTCEIDYSDEEREFLLAVDRYRTASRRSCPSLREMLAILRSLGYRRVAEPGGLPTFGRPKKGVSQCPAR